MRDLDLSKTQTKAWRYRLITNFLFGALILFLSLWNLFHPSGASLAILALQIGPLVLLIPGLIAQYYRTYSWLCFLILIYFIFAVEQSFMSTANSMHYIFLAFTVCIFVFSMMASRWQQRAHKKIPSTTNTESDK